MMDSNIYTMYLRSFFVIVLLFPAPILSFLSCNTNSIRSLRLGSFLVTLKSSVGTGIISLLDLPVNLLVCQFVGEHSATSLIRYSSYLMGIIAVLGNFSNRRYY